MICWLPLPALHLGAARRAAWLLVAGLAAAWAAGCGADRTRVPPGTTDPDKLLFERGTAALNDRKWLTAREYFRQIVDGYPQSPYRADAKLGLADTYLGERTAQSYVLAINEYREFLTFYPTHPRADYAQFKLAMSHYYQMAKPERDQTETREALKEFEAFFERFPNSPLAEEARQRQREARDRLSESEFRVGLFYYRARWYPGALDRFREVLKADPGFTRRDAVYYYLGETLVKVQRPAEALPYYERLIEEFERSEYLEEARKRVAELKGAATQKTVGAPAARGGTGGPAGDAVGRAAPPTPR
jgi:outer membrane protein assembly factor BamD